MLRHVLVGFYGLLLSVFFGLVWSAQVLGFLGVYTLPAVLLTTLLVSAIAAYGYLRLDPFALLIFGGEGSSEDSAEIPQKSTSLDAALLVATLLIFATVFLFRMIAWPYSELGQSISPDFFSYHAVRVVDLANSGTLWNLSIPYGQYPNGYESILSFFYLLTGSVEWAGLVQAMTVLLLVLTFALLLSRYASFPLSLSLAMGVTLLFVPYFYGIVLLIGKNDLLLTTMVLVAVLHAPIGIEDRRWHPLGLAYATMIAIATKATGVYLLGFLWLLVLWHWWQAYQAGHAARFLHPAVFVLSLVLMFPGGLWVIRNVLMMGQLVSPEIASFSVTSIAANLTNPLLYSSGSESTLLIVGFVAAAGMLILLIVTRRFAWDVALFWLVLILAFAITPLGAFHTPQSTTLHVEWRYALHVPMLGLVLLLVLLAPLILRVYRLIQQQRVLRYTAAASVLLGVGGMVILLNPTLLFSLDGERSRILVDTFHPKPDAPYDSVVDYAQQEIDRGAIFVAHIPWYYLMVNKPEISIQSEVSYPLGLPPLQEPPAPDYAVLHRWALRRDAAPPAAYEWELIYEDRTGEVYRRVR